MYIIDPFYIYLIEQLRAVNAVICIFTFISLFGIVVSIVTYNEKSEKKEDLVSGTMNFYLQQMRSELGYIKDNTKRISNSLDSKSDILGDYNKARINDLVARVTYKIPAIDASLKSVNEVVKEYNEKTDINHVKFFLCMFIICIILIIVIPTKDSAYKILFSSMITIERVTEAGQITTDVANDIVDKITESIIKINNSKQ